MTISRRASLLTVATVPLAVQAAAPASVWKDFPRQDAQVARDVVIAAHADLAKVKSLIADHPAAVNATIDWGFGDWETALGGAAHMGRREIAEFLLSSGARLDLFAAAMLGLTGVIKGMIAAQPGIEATPGPHGIPLLVHARAGGEKAKETFAYLQTLPGAARGAAVLPMDNERRKAFTGLYQAEDGRKVEVKLTSPAQLSLVMEGETPRWIHHAGAEAFYPAGSPKVQVKFDLVDGRPVRLRIVDGPASLVAARRE